MLDIIPSLLRSWEGDKMMSRACAPAWRGEAGMRRRRAWRSTYFLMRRVSISAEALQLLATAPPTPLPLVAFGLPENLYIWPRLVTLRLREITRCTQTFPSHGLRAHDLGRVGASETFVVRVRLLGWRPAITFLGSSFSTTTRYCSPSSSSVRLPFMIGTAERKIGTATTLHCIERDDYTDKCYVD
jgi:hypothetical protein